MSYRRIIVPTDGSENSAKGVGRGIELASAIGIPVRALYVQDTSVLEGLPYENLKARERKLLRRIGEEALDDAERAADQAGIEMGTEIAEGHPWQVITEIAGPDDLIVICSHGRSNIAKMLMGSVTAKVLAHTESDVLVVRR